MIPFIGLMDLLLRMASKKWDKAQMSAFKKGEPVKYRIVEAARGAITAGFFGQVRSFFFGGWFWDKLPSGYRCERMASHAFRFVAKGAGAIYWLIEMPRTKRFPSRIFRLLVPDITAAEIDEIANAPECLWDEFARAFRAWFKRLTISKAPLRSKYCNC